MKVPFIYFVSCMYHLFDMYELCHQISIYQLFIICLPFVQYPMILLGIVQLSFIEHTSSMYQVFFIDHLFACTHHVFIMYHLFSTQIISYLLYNMYLSCNHHLFIIGYVISRHLPFIDDLSCISHDCMIYNLQSIKLPCIQFVSVNHHVVSMYPLFQQLIMYCVRIMCVPFVQYSIILVCMIYLSSIYDRSLNDHLVISYQLCSMY